MGADYLIFTDVSTDIDKEMLKKYDIRFVPMEYVLGTDTFYCEQPETEEMMHNFYEKIFGTCTCLNFCDMSFCLRKAEGRAACTDGRKHIGCHYA